MKSTTAHVIETSNPDRMAEAIALGWQLGATRYARHDELERAHRLAFEIQRDLGFSRETRDMLTHPKNNTKLNKAIKLSYGLTLMHYVMRSLMIVNGANLIVNSCPFAGDCTKLCVINNGHGRSPVVQLAWRWRTEMLVNHPHEFALLLAHQLRKAVERDGDILFRPNVNSDIEWPTIMPTLFDGSLTGERIGYYGYTKIPTLLGDGWVTPVYRTAFSANESIGWDDPRVLAFLDRGGNVAVVTNRERAEPVRQWAGDIRVVDADVSDEWILNERGVIGDLAFKPDNDQVAEWGRASDFVLDVYAKEAA